MSSFADLYPERRGGSVSPSVLQRATGTEYFSAVDPEPSGAVIYWPPRSGSVILNYGSRFLLFIIENSRNFRKSQYFMSFCRILSTLCIEVVFHNLPHFGKRAGQKVQRKIAVAVQNVKPLYFLSSSFALSPQKSAELSYMFL